MRRVIAYCGTLRRECTGWTLRGNWKTMEAGCRGRGLAERISVIFRRLKEWQVLQGCRREKREATTLMIEESYPKGISRMGNTSWPRFILKIRSSRIGNFDSDRVTDSRRCRRSLVPMPVTYIIFRPYRHNVQPFLRSPYRHLVSRPFCTITRAS